MVLKLMQRVSLFSELLLSHHLNHSLEVRNNGWIMHRILAIGVRIRWKLLMLESHMLLQFNWKIKLELHPTCMVSLPIKKANLFQDPQLHHLHNLSLEARNNGWIMPRILAIGVMTK
jgi:hypothetical protein